MTWNILQVVEFGATSDGLHPVPTGSGLGFELGERDTNPRSVPIAGVKVIRANTAGAWVPSLNVLRTKGRMIVTDDRVVVSFDKFVPKDLSSFRPVTAEHPDGK